MLKDLKVAIREICKTKNYDPLSELVDLVQEKGRDKLTLEQKISIHKELLQYLAPKLKAVDIQANVQGDIKISVVRFSDLTNANQEQKVINVDPAPESSQTPALDLKQQVTDAILDAVSEDEEEENGTKI